MEIAQRGKYQRTNVWLLRGVIMDIRCVFLVDDDPDIRQIAEISLGEVGGWKVSLASSGVEAIDMMRNLNPDVILLDVMMPEMDGPSIFLKLREIERFANTPIIFITAKVQKHEVDHYMAIGASGCISKPFNPMTLPDEISEITKNL